MRNIINRLTTSIGDLMQAVLDGKIPRDDRYAMHGGKIAKSFDEVTNDLYALAEPDQLKIIPQLMTVFDDTAKRIRTEFKGDEADDMLFALSVYRKQTHIDEHMRELSK